MHEYLKFRFMTRYIKLLKSNELERYNSRPAFLREELSMLPEGELVIVDEF